MLCTGTIAAKTYVLATGSRDRSILMRDVRVKDNYTSILNGHKQEVRAAVASCHVPLALALANVSCACA
jgi:hypothetical protein